MTVMQAELYDALKSAGADEDKARQASIVSGSMKTDLITLKVMVGLDLALTVTILGFIFNLK